MQIGKRDSCIKVRTPGDLLREIAVKGEKIIILGYGRRIVVTMLIDQYQDLLGYIRGLLSGATPERKDNLIKVFLEYKVHESPVLNEVGKDDL